MSTNNQSIANTANKQDNRLIDIHTPSTNHTIDYSKLLYNWASKESTVEFLTTKLNQQSNTHHNTIDQQLLSNTAPELPSPTSPTSTVTQQIDTLHLSPSSQQVMKESTQNINDRNPIVNSQPTANTLNTSISTTSSNNSTSSNSPVTSPSSTGTQSNKLILSPVQSSHPNLQLRINAVLSPTSSPLLQAKAYSPTQQSPSNSPIPFNTFSLNNTTAPFTLNNNDSDNNNNISSSTPTGTSPTSTSPSSPSTHTPLVLHERPQHSLNQQSPTSTNERKRKAINSTTEINHRLVSPSPPRSPAVLSRRPSLGCYVPASPRPETQYIRQFYFPYGTKPVTPNTKNRTNEQINAIFMKHNNKLNRHELLPLTTIICGLSSFCTNLLYNSIYHYYQLYPQKMNSTDIESYPNYITQHLFIQYYTNVLQNYDICTRLYILLSHSLINTQPAQHNDVRSLYSTKLVPYITREHFYMLIEEVVQRHTGLEFLEHTPEFQLKYAQTVIGRIYYHVNIGANERMTCNELKNSNFLATLNLLDSECDINKIHAYFSYEHFYVIYCYFWELNSPVHDQYLDKSCLCKYDNGSLNERCIDRIVSGQCRPLLSDQSNKLNYDDFIIFFISEIDKSSETAINYWYNCISLDSNDYLSLYEIEYFWYEQKQRIQQLSNETLHFTDILCQLLDALRVPVDMNNNTIDSSTGQPLVISKSIIRNSSQSSLFFNTLVNLNKFVQNESRDPNKIKYINDTPQLTDWDRYAIAGYYRLADAEIESNQQNEEDIDQNQSNNVWNENSTDKLNDTAYEEEEGKTIDNV